MFNSISWTAYFSVMAAAGAVYYLFLAAVFYSEECAQILKGKHPLFSKKAPVARELTGGQHPTNSTVGVDQLQQKITEIQGILQSAGTGTGKVELLELINKSLVSYDGLHLPLHRDALAMYITKKAEELCGVGFSADELQQGWRSLPR